MENEGAGTDQTRARSFRANIPVPSKLDVHSRNLEVSWRKFKRQWENYEVASRLNAESKDYRKAVFLSVIGEEAFDISEGFSYTHEEDEDDIEVLISKFDTFCIGESNEIYETFVFNKRCQEEGEMIDAYVASLRKLAKTCNFGDKEERMIRDRVVLGVRDDVIRQKLLEDRKLTLTTAIELCRAHESSHLQVKAMTTGASVTVDALRQKQKQPHRMKEGTAKMCKKCGRLQHKKISDCPAKDAECHRCHKRGHYSSVCYSKPGNGPRMSHSHKDIHYVSAEQGGFLGTVSSLHEYADQCSARQRKDPRMSHSQASAEQDLFLGTVSSRQEDADQCSTRQRKDPRMSHSQASAEQDLTTSADSTERTEATNNQGKCPCMSHPQDNHDRGAEQDCFLGASSTDGSEPWQARVQVEGKTVNFKLDTGADVTVVPNNCVSKKMQLRRSDKKLYGPGQTMLEVSGKFNAKLRYKNVTITEEIYVVENLQQPLLGRSACETLQIVRRIDTLKAGEPATDYKAAHPKLFTGLGTMTEPYTIRLKEEAVPYAVSAPRRVPLPLQKKVQAELKRLEDLNVIRPMTKPTDWCAPIVVVPKENSDAIRLCVDLTKLNESVRREHFPLPSTDQLLAQLDGATVFTRLDANSGFHQVMLDESSQELTTFITPFGRYCYTRLPFGISSGSEVFHRRMSQLLSGIPGVICDIDDVLVSGRCQEEHDQRLHEVLQRLEKEGVTLNEKCKFSQSNIRFLGHEISERGIEMDKEKVKAIQEFPRPTNASELRRLLGMINYVQKFAPDLADLTKPLRELLKKEIQWTWGEAQENAFTQLKEKMSSPPVLAHYSPDLPTKVSADSSSYGLGSVLLQQQKNGEWRPISYASRSLTATEQRYAQVEKEALACTWACEKFADFLVGIPSFILETDHSPLQALLKTKGLDELSPRIQRFRMRLMRFSYTVLYTAGKNLTTADALSRAPTGNAEEKDFQLESDTKVFVRSVIDSLPASPGRLADIKAVQQKDPVCRKIMDYCREGWPVNKFKVDPLVRQYFPVRNDLSVQEGLLLFGTRLVIPEELRKDILHRIHDGHQGIVKCRAMARSSVWWPGISRQVQTMVENCGTCEKHRCNRPEPLKPSSVPDHPFQRVGMDLFEWQGQEYLLVVDYFSRNVELAHLRSSTTSETVITHCKSIFARHGIPETVHSDNGPQFASRVFAQFAASYGFTHQTSSPHHPEGNGEAERAVKTVKNFLSKAEDPYLALLQYRATPLQCGYSPAEMSMGRRLRTRVPVIPSSLIPDWPKLQDMKCSEMAQKTVQKKNYDRRHRAVNLPELSPGDPVWIKHPKETRAVVVKPAGPRSYEVQTPEGRRRRNRRHLNRRRSEPTTPGKVNPAVSSTLPSGTTQKSMKLELDPDLEPETVPDPRPAPLPIPPVAANQTDNATITRSGRVVKPVQKLNL